MSTRGRSTFWLLAVVIGTATIGMHVFVPALPLIARELDVTPAAAQQTISVYMLALAGGQIVYGPLSDWYGRRPVLIAGLLLYIAAGLIAAFASSLDMLLWARVAQGAGGCAGFVLGRAIVNDTSRNADAAARISALNSILLISPALAPILGVWIVDAYGWRGILVLLATFGSIALIGVVALLPETSAPSGQTLGALAAGYGRLLRYPPFLGYVIGGSLTTATMFALLGSSPFILVERLGRPLHELSYFYTAMIAGVMIGNAVSGRLLRRFAFENLMIAGCICGAAGATLIFLANLLDGLTSPVFLAGGVLYTTMTGLMAPLSLTRAVELAPALRGTASGVYGSSQMAIGGAAVALASYGSDVAGAMSSTLLTCSGAGLAICIALKVWREARVRA